MRGASSSTANVVSSAVTAGAALLVASGEDGGRGGRGEGAFTAGGTASSAAGGVAPSVAGTLTGVVSALSRRVLTRTTS